MLGYVHNYDQVFHNLIAQLKVKQGKKLCVTITPPPYIHFKFSCQPPPLHSFKWNSPYYKINLDFFIFHMYAREYS